MQWNSSTSHPVYQYNKMLNKSQLIYALTRLHLEFTLQKSLYIFFNSPSAWRSSVFLLHPADFDFNKQLTEQMWREMKEKKERFFNQHI